MNLPYASRLVVDKLTLSLWEVSATASERTIRVMLRPGASWDVVLPLWNDPSIAVLSETTYAIWAVSRLYVLDLAAPPIRADFDEEVRAVYRLEQRLCIVSELAVFVYDPARAVVVDRYLAKDVLGTSWWEGDRLWVEASGGTHIQFTPSANSVGGPVEREG